MMLLVLCFGLLLCAMVLVRNSLLEPALQYTSLFD